MVGLDRKLRPALASLSLLSCLLAPANLHAADTLDRDTREAARKLGYSGIEAYQAGNYGAASEKLDKAYRVAAVPSLGLWSARALVKLGKLVEAAERYREVGALRVSSGDQAVQKKAQAEAASDLVALEAKIPKLTVHLEGAAASEVNLTINGKPFAAEQVGLAQPLNPGSYRVEASRGAEQASVEVTLSEGEQKPVVLELGAAPAPAPVTTPLPAEPARAGLGRQRTLALVAGGVGVVGVVVGSVFGLKSKSSHDEAANYCSGSVCRDQRGVNAGEDAYSSGTISTVAMVVGGVGLAGGAVLWLTAPSSHQEPTAGFAVGPGSLQLRGSF